MVAHLERNEVDFALVSWLPSHLKLSSVDMLENRLLLIGSGSALVKKRNTADLLESVPLIYREEGSATRSSMEAYIGAQQIAVKKKLVLTSNEAVKQAVIAGLGYSIMPVIGLKNELREGQLQVIPAKGLPIVSRWHLVWLTEKNLSPAARAYLDFIRAEKEQIVASAFGWLKDFSGHMD